MKILHLLLFFCCLAFNAQALTITVNGTVTDTNGDPVEGVTINIATDSTVLWPGYSNQVLTDASGAYSDTFDVPDNLTQGAIYISMVDCNGNIVSQTTYWSPAGVGVVDFTYCAPEDNCTVSIAVDDLGSGFMLTAVAGGTAPFAFSWETGATSESITVTEPGTYCVTISTAAGCMVSDCVTVQNGADCGVQVSPNPAGALSAFATGTAPFTYLWSTGDNTADIFPNAEGLYCVTVTDATGCEATGCFQWTTGGGDTSCYVQILLVQGGSFLQADAEGVAPFTYFWNSGENTASIMPSQPGEYCVTVIDASGCESTDCYTFGNPDPEYSQLSGYVYYWDSTNQVQNGWVILYGLTPGGGLEAVDTADIVNGGYYDFGEVGAGSYTLRAVLSEDDAGYTDYLPTYFGNVLTWDEATTVVLPANNWWSYNIILLDSETPEGPGVISGTIIEEPGFTSDEEVDDRDDTPIEFVSVLLFSEVGVPLAYDMSNANGEFSFPSLAWGTYQLIVEIPGLSQAEYWVTIGPDQPEVTDIVFVVTDELITTGVEEWLEATQVLVFPQPAGNQVEIRFELPEATDIQLQILDNTGKILFQKMSRFDSGQQNLELNTSEWPQGLYFYNLRAGKQVLAGKLIKG